MSGEIKLADATDVLPSGFSGTPWETVFNILASLVARRINGDPSSVFTLSTLVHSVAGGVYPVGVKKAVADALLQAYSAPFIMDGYGVHGENLKTLAAWMAYRGTEGGFVGLFEATGASYDGVYAWDAARHFAFGDAQKSALFDTGLPGDITAKFVEMAKGAIGARFEVMAQDESTTGVYNQIRISASCADSDDYNHYYIAFDTPDDAVPYDTPLRVTDTDGVEIWFDEDATVSLEIVSQAVMGGSSFYYSTARFEVVKAETDEPSSSLGYYAIDIIRRSGK